MGGDHLEADEASGTVGVELVDQIRIVEQSPSPLEPRTPQPPSTPPAVTVVLVDDHEIVDAGVRSWCADADPPIDVVDSGTNEIVAWTGAGATADVVVLDLLLRGDEPDLGVLRRLVEAGRHVVVFTQFVHKATVCIKLGALAYVTKAEGRDHLIDAIRQAAQGRCHTSPSLGGALLVDDTPDRPTLTAAEVDALRAWFITGSKDLAAKRLGKTTRAIDRLIEKVRLRYALIGRPAPTQAMLLARALQDGLISIEEMGELSTDSRPPAGRTPGPASC